MNLSQHVDSVREQLAVAAEAGGDEARELAQRLTAPLDPAVRLMLLDVLATAAAEITQELAPGSVELRLRGGEPEFVVTPPPVDTDMAPGDTASTADAWPGSGPAAEGGVSRINLRLPDQLKSRVEQAADQQGLSINAWMVRAAAAAVERGQPGVRTEPGTPTGGQRHTGWSR